MNTTRARRERAHGTKPLVGSRDTPKEADERRQRLPQEYRWLAFTLDETRYRDLPALEEACGVRPEKILGVYVFTPDECTYLCEGVPSFCLYNQHCDVVEFSDDESADGRWQKFYAWAEEGTRFDEPVSYVHCADVYRLVPGLEALLARHAICADENSPKYGKVVDKEAFSAMYDPTRRWAVLGVTGSPDPENGDEELGDTRSTLEAAQGNGFYLS